MSSYSEYYDRIYSDKDYKHEVDVIWRCYVEAFDEEPKTVLDIGCGTGNHAVAFSRLGAKVTAVDKDPKMLEVAKTKTAKVQFKGCARGDFDLAVLLFNVVNYVKTEHDLHDLLCSNRYRMLVLDCWNGDLCRRDPPQTKVKSIKGLTVVTKNRHQGEFFQVTDTIYEKGDLACTSGYIVRPWTIDELIKILSIRFKAIKSCEWMQPDQEFRGGRKLMIVAS